jgi:hypothetical protein
MSMTTRSIDQLRSGILQFCYSLSFQYMLPITMFSINITIIGSLKVAGSVNNIDNAIVQIWVGNSGTKCRDQDDWSN